MTARTPERSISPRRPSCRWAAICRSSARTAASTAGTERWGWGNSGVRASPPPPPHLTLGQHLFLHVVIFAEVDVRFDVSEGLRCGVGVSTDSPRVPDPPAKPPKAPTWVRVSPHCWYSRPSSPSICRSACCRCASVSAWMRSRSPSAAVRSSFPRWNARRVNSPGSAGRSPERRPESGHQHREGWGGWGGGGHPRGWGWEGLTQRPQHSAHHRRPAVHVQLRAVLPGEAVGSCSARGAPSIPQGCGGGRRKRGGGERPRAHSCTAAARGQRLMLEQRWSCLCSAGVVVPGEPRGAAASWSDGQTPTWQPELTPEPPSDPHWTPRSPPWAPKTHTRPP